MKRNFSVFAIAAMMLLGMGGNVFAQDATNSDLDKVGATGATMVRRGTNVSSTPFGTCGVKVTKMPSGNTPGFVTITDAKTSTFCEDIWNISAYFTDKSGRKFIVTKIGSNAFANAPCHTEMTGIWLNYFVSDFFATKPLNTFDYDFEIAAGAFNGCTNLVAFGVSQGGNSRYIDCTSIGANAFKNCSKLKDLWVHASKGGIIGASAFENCSALSSTLYISGSIDATAFNGCTSVTQILWYGGYTTKLSSYSDSPMYPMRRNVTSIKIYGAVPAYFFYDFTALTEVTSTSSFFENMKNTNIYAMGIGEYGFGYCTSLQSIQVAGEINKYAFYGCKNLTSITYRGGWLANDQIPQSGSDGFFNPIRNNITSFTIEETSASNKKPNYFLPAYICYGMTKLTKVTIPDYVSSIGDGAFSNCSALTTVTINKSTSTLNTINPKAFYSCSALNSITLPVSLVYVHDEAFEWCESLKTCPLNSEHTKLLTIGKNAFYQAGLTSFYVPASVTKLGTMLIGGSKCNVTTITYMPKNLSRSNIGGSWANLFIGTQDLYKSQRNAVTKFRVNSELASVPDSLCWNYTGLNYFYDNNDSKTLSSLIEIGKASFAKCTGLFYSVTSQFPNLEEIGESAFEECGNNFILSKFPKVKKIGNKAFKNSKVYKMNAMGFEDLTTIGDEAFAGCSALEIIHIPAKVTKIGTDAFKDCPKATELIWNTANYALEDPLESVRQNIETVTIGEDATTIPTQLLYQSKIKKLTIPEKVETVGYYSFASCTSLDSVIVLTNAEKTSDNMPFTGNSKMKKVIYKGEATSIPDHMFAGAGVNEVVWGNINTINAYAFENTAFSTLTLNNISTIADGAFSGLSNLKEISIAGTAPTITSKTFENTTGVTVIKASCNTVDALKADDKWTAVCSNIQASDTKYTEEYLDDLLGHNKIGDWYEYWQWSYNGSIEVVNALDCEGNVTLKCIPNEGYKFAYWRGDGNKTNPRDFDLSKWNLWYLGGLCYNDANIYQTNFTVEPEGAGALKITNQYGHSRNDQKFLAVNIETEEAYLTPMETNGWYQFKEWKVDGMYSTYPYEVYDKPGTYSMNLMVMENMGMGEMDPETPSEPTYNPEFDPNMKAIFEIKDIDVTVELCSDANGSVTIAEDVNQKVGSTVNLTAVAKEGYMFDKWSDGNTDAKRTVVITPALLIEHRVMGMDMESGEMMYEDYPVDMGGGSIEMYRSESTYSMQLCAEFKVDPNYKKKYTITAEPNDEAKGTVTGGGVYEEGSEATLTATAKTGFDFVGWSDEVTDNPRKVTVTGDASYQAVFVIHVNYYDIKTAVEPEDAGTVIGGGNYAENTDITLEAKANSGYEFVQWSDGVKTATREVKVTKNETYTAQFKALENFFTITTIAKPAEGGVVVGGGQYAENKVIQLAAVPNEGYEFAQWEDGVKTAVREITVTKDETYTAVFKTKGSQQFYTITTMVSPEEGGVVVGGGKYAANTIIKLKAVANDGYEFLQWDDGNKDNPREITVNEDAVYKAIFKKIETYYTINVFSADPEAGTVIGTGSYVEGSEIQIAAMPNTGYRFKMWNDQNTDNPRTITVTANAIYVANFVKIQDALEDINAEIKGTQKVFFDGQLYIVRDGVWYNVLGGVVRK